MPKILTMSQVKKLKHEGKNKVKAYSIDSTCALYLVCFENGSKFYKLRTKNKQITLGNYNDITLAQAREKAVELRKINDGLSIKKQNLKSCFYEWLDIKIPNDDTENTRQKRRKMINKVNKYILTPLGDVIIYELNKIKIINATKGMSLVSAKKSIGILRDVLKYARSQNYIKDIGFIFEIIEDKNEIFADKKVKHMKAIIDAKRLKQIIEIVKNSYINISVKNMFFLNLLTAQRPHQIRELTWDRVDLQNGFIFFNETQNKTGLNVRLPLSKQAIKILKEQNLISGHGELVFRSDYFSKVSGWGFSEATLLKALKGLGIDDLHAHGFRSMLATFAIRATHKVDGVERGMFEKRVIDEVLLHTAGSEVDKAYFRDFNTLEQLRLLQWWADFLESL